MTKTVTFSKNTSKFYYLTIYKQLCFFVLAIRYLLGILYHWLFFNFRIKDSNSRFAII